MHGAETWAYPQGGDWGPESEPWRCEGTRTAAHNTQRDARMPMPCCTLPPPPPPLPAVRQAVDRCCFLHAARDLRAARRGWAPMRQVGVRDTDAFEGKGPQRQPERRLDRRLEEVAGAVGGGYCRLQMALKLALGVRGTVAGHRLGALEGLQRSGVDPPFRSSRTCLPRPSLPHQFWCFSRAFAKSRPLCGSSPPGMGQEVGCWLRVLGMSTCVRLSMDCDGVVAHCKCPMSAPASCLACLRLLAPIRP